MSQQSTGVPGRSLWTVDCGLSPRSSREAQPSVKIGITCYPTFGGSGVVATELGIALANRGDEVHFISYALPSRLSMLIGHERIRFHEVTVTNYPLFDPYPPYMLA